MKGEKLVKTLPGPGRYPRKASQFPTSFFSVGGSVAATLWSGENLKAEYWLIMDSGYILVTICTLEKSMK
jgi:hypothetical protein